ncbi:MAG: tetratricopeptide repeat protein [Anaerolineae bacterium]
MDRIEPLAEQCYQVGKNHLDRQLLEEAKALFERALEINPRHFRARLYLGETLLEIGEIDRAVEALNEAYELDREEARAPLVRALQKRAVSRLEKQQRRGVGELFKRVLELSPDNVDALRALTGAATLRLTQITEGPDSYCIEVALEAEGLPRQTATVRFDFALNAQDQEDLRWYLEDYLQYPLDPAPTIAARIEKRTAEFGAELFRAVFQADDNARNLWAMLRTRLSNTRFEIITGVQEGRAIPWELIRDPDTDTWLALSARAFVHAQHQAAQLPQLPQTASGPVRILLVISRPIGGYDVPFRSVAIRIIKGLSGSAREAFQLDVLRPPTFEQLSRVLYAAKDAGQPYHVVHFDGHGMYTEVIRPGEVAEMLRKLSPLLLSGPRTGAYGYLLFENPALEESVQLVDGPALGKLLVETGVPVLVLTSCSSAYAEAPDSPLAQAGEEATDVHIRVRAFGSVAQEVMDAGVAGVVAMRYRVYVVTAAQFMADLYAGLAQGSTLGEAVTLGRKQLHAQALRTIAYDPIPLQDWPVPVVYETAPIALFPKPAKEATLTITLEAGDATPERGILDPSLPPSPDVGFFGRDETLLALDRAFDSHSIVLLHAYAGSGKTATAAEFARWYALTGGVEGPVLFTSFEQYKPLARVLDQIEQVFGPALEAAGVHWLALPDAGRRQVALQVLHQVPVLWIWDHVEPVVGFPAGTESAWSTAEQQELLDFLRAARETKAKFLLTSRREERAWLGDLPARLTLPPMPIQEGVQLARALAEKHGRRLADMEDWRPLLRFTQGNPLTITVLVGQVLRDGLKTKEQIEAFVAQLRAGEAAFEDEESDGRAKSLGASLSYGFEHAFNEDERKKLALLHFFQGFVDVDVLRTMGHPKRDWCLPEVRGLTREDGIALLDRAAEVGLLTAHGGGYYTIHPALPWYFRSLFEQYYAPTSSPPPQAGPALSEVEGEGEREGALAATSAFVEAMGELGNYYHSQYEDGNREVIAALTAEEANLLHARQLALRYARSATQDEARRHGWWRRVIGTMQGLRTLYDHTGRRAEWRRLVEEIVPDFVDPVTDGPLPGREQEWSLVTEYRVRLAREARQWAEAKRLQRTRLEWDRQRAKHALSVPLEALDAAGRNAVRSLAESLYELGEIQRELGQPESVSTYEEACTLVRQLGDQPAEAAIAINLGRAYLTLPSIRDLARAEQWYRRGLELTAEHDKLGQSRSLGQLGLVAHERFKEGRAANKPKEELLRHLNDAAQFYHQALDLLPPNAVNDLATAHSALGAIYGEAGDFDRALSHYREAIRYSEAAGNVYAAANTRFNVALALAQAGRLADAREYAYAALRNFQTYGDRAAAEIQRTQELIGLIEQAMSKT